MLPKQIEKVNIESLVANEVKESRTLEYKQVLPSGQDEERREFLADVSSFANASGGDLVYGMEEKRDGKGQPTGVPASAPGLAIANLDAEIRRLESMIRDGIEPRIAGIRFQTVEGFSSGPVLIIRIPKSYAAPHMVTFKNLSRFHSRTSSGKYQLDVAEIRSAFALSESLPERVRRFRDERLARIVADETSVPLPPQHVRFVLHLLPVSALDPTTCIDISNMPFRLHTLPPLGTHVADGRYNIDGFVTYRTFANSSLARCYTQLFRSGAIEAVEGGMIAYPTPQTNHLRFAVYEEWLLQGLARYLKFQQELELQPPVFVLLSIIGVKGYRLTDGQNDWQHHHQIDRDTLLLPDVLAEDFDCEPDIVLRPAFDAMWQAADWPKSPNYTPDGRWLKRS